MIRKTKRARQSPDLVVVESGVEDAVLLRDAVAVLRVIVVLRDDALPLRLDLTLTVTNLLVHVVILINHKHNL